MGSRCPDRLMLTVFVATGLSTTEGLELINSWAVKFPLIMPASQQVIRYPSLNFLIACEVLSFHRVFGKLKQSFRDRGGI
jgi:hypothetical protein